MKTFVEKFSYSPSGNDEKLKWKSIITRFLFWQTYFSLAGNYVFAIPNLQLAIFTANAEGNHVWPSWYDLWNSSKLWPQDDLDKDFSIVLYTCCFLIMIEGKVLF